MFPKGTSTLTMSKQEVR